MNKFKVYDKVSWHFPEGKNCPSLEVALNHIEIIMKWLNENNLLSAEGVEMLEIGIDSDFSITSTMLSKNGNEIMSQNYSEWLKTIRYTYAYNFKLLELRHK